MTSPPFNERWRAPRRRPLRRTSLGRATPRAGGKEAFFGYWFALPIRLYICDNAPAERHVSIHVDAPDGPVTIETVGDGVTARAQRKRGGSRSPPHNYGFNEAFVGRVLNRSRYGASGTPSLTFRKP
jgi:hypothetical protein